MVTETALSSELCSPSHSAAVEHQSVSAPIHCAVQTTTVVENDRPSNYLNQMLHLDSNGYPTRALYYLHKRLLDVLVNPTGVGGFVPAPQSRLFSVPRLKENDLDLGGNDAAEVTNILEQKRVLRCLCATLIGRDYVHPPTPPAGASPCHTPPRFKPPGGSLNEPDEASQRVARFILESPTYNMDDLEMLDMLEVELEVDLETKTEHNTPKTQSPNVALWSSPSIIRRSSNDEEGHSMVAGTRKNKRTLLDEVQGVVSPCAEVDATIKAFTAVEKLKKRQAKRRARNSLNGTRESVTQAVDEVEVMC